jgi:hypothetical protein
MRNTPFRTWNLTRKLKNVEKGTKTSFDLEYGKKFSKTWKMTNANCRNWSLARK